jgi:hypothetical protein
METVDLMHILQISLTIALIVSIILYGKDSNAPPTDDPWFITILAALVWLSFK